MEHDPQSRHDSSRRPGRGHELGMLPSSRKMGWLALDEAVEPQEAVRTEADQTASSRPSGQPLPNPSQPDDLWAQDVMVATLRINDPVLLKSERALIRRENRAKASEIFSILGL